MQNVDFTELNRYAKQLAKFSPEQENLLRILGPEIRVHLQQLTDGFYEDLTALPEAAAFLGDRTEQLKNTHLAWLEVMFSGTYDESYIAYMYRVGYAHVKVGLPVEFMAGGITLISRSAQILLQSLYGNDQPRFAAMMESITSVLGYSLIAMQQSFQLSTEEQLEKFLKITGISRELYSNMAKIYRS